MDDFPEKLKLWYERSYICGELVGLYLSDEQLKSVQEILTADIPPCGAIGRYRRTPVFRLAEAANAVGTVITTPDGIVMEVFD
jgi:hypothetical protein